MCRPDYVVVMTVNILATTMLTRLRQYFHINHSTYYMSRVATTGNTLGFLLTSSSSHSDNAVCWSWFWWDLSIATARYAHVNVNFAFHCYDVIMSAMASQITSPAIIYSSVYSGADQRKHQSSVSLGFVRGIRRWPVNSPHKGPVTRNFFPFDEAIMSILIMWFWSSHKLINSSMWKTKAARDCDIRSPGSNIKFPSHFPNQALGQIVRGIHWRSHDANVRDGLTQIVFEREAEWINPPDSTDRFLDFKSSQTLKSLIPLKACWRNWKKIWIFWLNVMVTVPPLGPLLLTWFNFNPSMDK